MHSIYDDDDPLYLLLNYQLNMSHKSYLSLSLKIK